MEEYLDVFSEDGTPKGAMPRSIAHKKGLWHQVIHCWIVSRTEDGVRLYFQQRSPDKAAFPNKYDLAVGGHISAGEDMYKAAQREIEEEVGLTLPAEELEYLGKVKEEFELPTTIDREIAHVFYYETDCPRFHIGDEVSRMVWVRLRDYLLCEEEGRALLPVYTMDNQRIMTTYEDWCHHFYDFDLVYPRIMKK